MIKATDLRIGNIVFSAMIDEPFKVSNLTTDYDPLCKPIEITEEWLLRFGFVYHDDDGIITYSRDNIVIFQRYRLDFYFELSNYKDAELEYVHQLQNLYYALTGEELTHGK
jgi:hypothetical protein